MGSMHWLEILWVKLLAKLGLLSVEPFELHPSEETENDIHE